MKQSVAFSTLSSDSLLKHMPFLPCRKLLLVRGGKSYCSCGAAAILTAFFKEKNISVVEFSDFSANPKQEDLERGIKLATSHQPDAILAVGGGSVIDMAKLIRFYLSYEETVATDGYSQIAPLIPLGIIPTTAGTGSESTHFAVLYRQGAKHSIAHEDILPNHVLADADLCLSASPYQIACSGLDALCQAIESCWSVRSTPESRVYALNALNFIYPALKPAIFNKNKKALKQLLIGANLAGKAINISFTTAPHAYSYGLTMMAGLPHGHAVACFLPYFFKLNNNITDEACNDLRGVKHVISTLNAIAECLGYSLQEAPNALKNMIVTLLPESCTLTRNRWGKILQGVNMSRLSNNPVKINEHNAPTPDDLHPFIRITAED